MEGTWLGEKNVTTKVKYPPYFRPTKIVSHETIYNFENFGNLLYHKKRILAWLKGIQYSLEFRPNAFLSNLETNRTAEFNHILSLEEDFWALRSCVSGHWDSNTHFFHLSTINRCSNNRIYTMRDAPGVTIVDHGLLSNHITDHFKSLFTTDHVSENGRLSTAELGNMHFPMLDSDCHVALCAPPTNSEFWAVVKSFKPWKAPGPNGLHLAFFQ